MYETNLRRVRRYDAARLVGFLSLPADSQAIAQVSLVYAKIAVRYGASAQQKRRLRIT
jgi:hypothetical protein